MAIETPAALRDDPARSAPGGRPGVPVGWAVLAGLAITAGLALRWASTSPLWLDEALTVTIARLPVGGLVAALRHDGSPPLYYLLLHAWIRLAGAGDVAVRLPSAVFSVLTVAALARLGTRLGGRRLAVAVTLLSASSPFAIRYAGEARMYALLALESACLALAVERSRRRGGPLTAVACGLPALALVYTHYWALFLVVPLGIALLVFRLRGDRAAGAPLAGLIAAGVGFAPQLPTLLYQSAHTGAPWAPPANPRDLLDTVVTWSGPGAWGAVLLLLGLAMAWRGVEGAPREVAAAGPPGRARTTGRVVLAGLAVPLVVAEVAAQAGGTGFVVRYTSVVWPAWILLLALGATVLSARAGRAVLAVLVCGGLVAGAQDVTRPRTQALVLARPIVRQSVPGDVVGYCPDQLAPDLHRLLPAGAGVQELSFADPGGPSRVDWVDYSRRMADADPAAFAGQLDAMAGPQHRVWLVRADGYRTLADDCARISEALRALRGLPVATVGRSVRYGESADLLLYGPQR